MYINVSPAQSSIGTICFLSIHFHCLSRLSATISQSYSGFREWSSLFTPVFPNWFKFNVSMGEMVSNPLNEACFHWWLIQSFLTALEFLKQNTAMSSCESLHLTVFCSFFLCIWQAISQEIWLWADKASMVLDQPAHSVFLYLWIICTGWYVFEGHTSSLTGFL